MYKKFVMALIAIFVSTNLSFANDANLKRAVKVAANACIDLAGNQDQALKTITKGGFKFHEKQGKRMHRFLFSLPSTKKTISGKPVSAGIYVQIAKTARKKDGKKQCFISSYGVKEAKSKPMLAYALSELNRRGYKPAGADRFVGQYKMRVNGQLKSGQVRVSMTSYGK